MYTEKKEKLKIVLAIVLLLPLLVIAYFSVQLITGITEFDKVSSVKLVTPDGNEFPFNDTQNISFYTSLMDRSSIISTAVRDIENETPAVLYLDNHSYELFPSRTVSGCMIRSTDGKLRLLNESDATSLIVRNEMTYLYKDSLLPRLSIHSGDREYAVQPDSFTWSYKKEDQSLYQDNSTEIKRDSPTFSLLADFENGFSFSTEPSQYSLSVHKLTNNTEGAEIPVTDFESLRFEQDTLLSVSLQAKWSQADNASGFGEATYRFAVLYDVPAKVELLQADANSTLSVTPGGWVVLRALYTNENEVLEIRTNCTTDNQKFYYDANSQCSYAFLPIGTDNPAGKYYVSVTSGETVSMFNLVVQDAPAAKIISMQVSDEDYEKYVTPDLLADLNKKLEDIRAFGEGSPLMTQSDTDLGMFVFGSPSEAAEKFPFGSDVLFSNSNDDDPGWYTLNGSIYEGEAGSDVRSVQSGTVLFAGYLAAGGNAIIVDHGCGICSYYYHLKDLHVAVGDHVAFGKIIGTMGSTGYTGEATCLHFAMSAGDTYFRP